eukprot:NODE_26910_length_533_cov_1.036946.p5 GENE.NODE_26910_length_533_cov_1.036946~~NODE_26910_length_533_cov_1.036946.p5  ORF type:complete len:66 (-),score=8.77 NODE_26910_length_533_cov_1.036946:220-417(-)
MCSQDDANLEAVEPPPAVVCTDALAHEVAAECVMAAAVLSVAAAIAVASEGAFVMCAVHLAKRQD